MADIARIGFQQIKPILDFPPDIFFHSRPFMSNFNVTPCGPSATCLLASTSHGRIATQVNQHDKNGRGWAAING